MPLENDEVLDTQDQLDVDEANDAGGNSDDGSDDQGNEPFLVVNDRQQYKTREEAIRGITEAGTRIAQLSAWEKELDRYGVKDPRIAAQLFDELLDARKQLSAAQKGAESAQNAGDKKNASGTVTDDEADLSKEDKAALKWLQKHAPRLGFVPKEELQALKKDFEDFKTSNTQSNEAAQESRRQSSIVEGRNSVTQFLATDKIQDPDGTKRNVIETLVTAWINADDKRVAEFYTGGVVLQNLLKEGYDQAKKSLGWGAQQQSSASAAVDKGKALHRNKTLPQAGASGKGTKQNDGVRKDAGGRKDFIGSAHEKAWALAQKHFSGTSAD